LDIEKNQTAAAPMIHVAPSPHVSNMGLTTRGMMLDVLIALIPVVMAAFLVFGWMAAKQLMICMVTSLAAEAVFTRMRARPFSLTDMSALITGLILGLSLPATAPWYVGCIGCTVAIGIGKMVFGGLGMNIFNPAMVGRAFVMIAFAGSLAASGYILPGGGVDILSQATPVTAFKQSGMATPLAALFWVVNLFNLAGAWTVLHQLVSGSLLFGAFFIATDPVTSPLTSRGKWIYGIGIGAVIMLLRQFSGYPEGVMFAVLLLNAVTPLINRWNIPRPFGGV